MLASFLLSLAVLGAHAATTVDLAPSDVVFSPGWTNETTRDGANSFLQAGEFLCAMTASLPPSASSVTYFGFSSPGAQYGYTVDCAADCVVTRVDGIDDDNDSSSSEVFSVSDLDPSVNHTLRVFNLGTDDSKINFDRLSVLVEDNADDSQDPNAGISPPVSANAASSTTTTTRPTILASLHVSSSASSGSGPSPSSKNTANPDASATTSNTDSSSPASPSASGTDGSSSSASSTSGRSSVSIKLVAGLTVFAVVVTAGILVLLFLCLRRRRRERRAYATSAATGRQPPSPTASIIPIMDPPPPHMSMRVSSGFPNPFADPDPASEPVAMFPDPYAVPQMSQMPPQAPVNNNNFVSPMAAVMQQRRQRSDSHSRSASPSSSAPTIPLPELPAEARLRDGAEFSGYGYGGRSDSPASSNNAQNNNNNGLWITRTPVKSQFSFAV